MQKTRNEIDQRQITKKGKKMTQQELYTLRIVLWLLLGFIFYVVRCISDKILKLKIYMTKMDYVINCFLGTIFGPVTLLIILKSLYDTFQLIKKQKDNNA